MAPQTLVGQCQPGSCDHSLSTWVISPSQLCLTVSLYRWGNRGPEWKETWPRTVCGISIMEVSSSQLPPLSFCGSPTTFHTGCFTYPQFTEGSKALSGAGLAPRAGKAAELWARIKIPTPAALLIPLTPLPSQPASAPTENCLNAQAQAPSSGPHCGENSGQSTARQDDPMLAPL